MSHNIVTHLLSAAIVLIFLLAINAAQGAPDPRDTTAFTAHVASAIKKQLPDATVDIEGPLTLGVKRNKASLAVNLDNIASDCARNPKGCDDAIANFARVVETALQDRAGPIQKSDIRVVVRPKAYVDQLRPPGEDSSKGPIVGLVVGDVWFVCVVDQPRNIASLAEDRAKELGLSRDEAIALAKANVLAALRPLATVAKDLPANGIGYIDGDFYESSRLVLHDEWAALSKKMNGNLIVAVPANDLVVYGDGSSREHLDAMATLVKHAAQKAARPLSARLFRWKPDGWEVVR